MQTIHLQKKESGEKALDMDKLYIDIGVDTEKKQKINKYRRLCSI